MRVCGSQEALQPGDDADGVGAIAADDQRRATDGTRCGNVIGDGAADPSQVRWFIIAALRFWHLRFTDGDRYASG